MSGKRLTKDWNQPLTEPLLVWHVKKTFPGLAVVMLVKLNNNIYINLQTTF